MRTIRRLYFYLVTLISLEIITWGVISLVRTVVGQVPGTSLLASGLALVLVGIPIFLLHWLTVQRDVARDEEERSSILRALFFYGARLAVLIPVASSLIALLNRLLLSWMGRQVSSSYFPGGGQTNADNIIAVIINLGIFFYLDGHLRKDWQEPQLDRKQLTDVRRLYRFIWLVMSLGIIITGVHKLLEYLLYQPGGSSYAPVEWLSSGMAMLLVAFPIWLYTGRLLRETMATADERRAALTLGVPYGIAAISAVTTLAMIANLADAAFRWALGEVQTFSEFLANNVGLITWLIPISVTWGYYYSRMSEQIALEDDELRRAAQQRLYRYILSLTGLAAVFLGGWALLTGLVDSLLGAGLLQNLRSQLAYGFAWLLAGLPVWLGNWQTLQQEAGCSDAMGDHARRSVARKGFLYLVLFVLVVAAMVSAGSAVYLAVSALLGSPEREFTLTFTQRLQTFGWVMLWLVYHLAVLRSDSRLAAASLAENHASFPILLVHHAVPEYSQALKNAISIQTPQLPVLECDLASELLSDEMKQTKAVVLPASLALNPPESLRNFLQNYVGRRLVVNTPAEDWTWPGMTEQDLNSTARDTARMVAQMAEGQPVKPRIPLSPVSVAAYVLAGLFLAEVLFLLIVMGVSFVFD